jgi:FkbM family methyltransferase
LQANPEARHFSMESPEKLAPASGSRWLRGILSLLLRPGRATGYTGRWKGHKLLLQFYRKYLPADLTFRVGNFDGDLKFDVNMRGEVDLCLWHYPELYEKEERELFCSLVQPGCTVLDVGAHIGFYTLLAAKRGARVFSVEADPRNAAQLRHHVAINGFSDRVTVVEIAATDLAKEVPLYRHPYNPGESNIMEKGAPACTVPGKTLDSLNLPPIDVCKMDIEGAELMALRGMEQTLKRSPHIKIMVEYAERLGAGEGLLSYLRENFSTVKVIEATTSGEIPAFCNLLGVR